MLLRVTVTERGFSSVTGGVAVAVASFSGATTWTSMSRSALSSMNTVSFTECMDGPRLRQSDQDQQHVDELDAYERHDHAAQAVHKQVAAKQRGGAQGAISHALQRQRDEEDDDQRVEDHRRQDRALRRGQVHHV